MIWVRDPVLEAVVLAEPQMVGTRYSVRYFLVTRVKKC